MIHEEAEAVKAPRVEDRARVTGSTLYVDDIPFDRLLYVEILRSRHAHARLLRVDAARARAAHGVAAAITYADLESSTGSFPLAASRVDDLRQPARSFLARDEVGFVGEPVAAVAAETRAAARDALEALEVDYEPLDAVIEPEAALEPDAPRAHVSLPDNLAFRPEAGLGDVDAAFRGADRVVRLALQSPRLAACALETRGAVAQWLPASEELILWSSTQAPHLLRSQLAATLQLRESAVRVIAPEVGGGFGSKRSAYAEEALVAILARRLAPRPVKWVESRRENLLATVHGRGQSAEIELALRADGKILGLRYDAVVDVGAYHPSCPAAAPELTAAAIGGPYRVPASRVSLRGAFTNKVPTDAYRGAGRAEATLAMERVLDAAAVELELDPIEIRRANFTREAVFRPPTGVALDAGDCPSALDRLLSACAYASLRGEQEARRNAGELVGIGLAAYLDVCAGGSSARTEAVVWETGGVRVGPAGDVEVFTGTSSQGQGQEAALARIASEILGVPPEVVRVRRGDTAAIHDGRGVAGSRSVAVGGSAVREAARRIDAKLRSVAAALLRVPVEYVERVDGGFACGGRRVSRAEVCLEAHRAASLPADTPPGLEELVHYPARGPISSFGAHLAFVSVDRDTGEVRLEKYFASDDFGRVVDLLRVEGQALGGIAQGIGQALLEEVVYDGSGQLLTSTLLEYALPRASHLPLVVCSRGETPSTANPLGARGAGEAGAIAAPPAIANAVVDALREFGVRHVDLPLRPEKVWRLIRAAEERGD